MTQTSSGASKGYEVGRPGGVCAVTGKPIQAGEKFHAGLRETPVGFERVDISLDAWKEFPKTDLLASWQTVMPAADAKKKVFVDDEVLLELFERLAETTEPSKLNFRFVLGLILMRKRLLIYENTRLDGEKEFWSVRRRGREGNLDLFNPRLGEEQIAEVSQQLSQVLNEEI